MSLSTRSDSTESSLPPPEDFSLQLHLSIWMLAGLAGIFLGLRIVAKVLRGRGLWWDDRVLIISWIALATGCSLQSYDTRYGFARNDKDPETLVLSKIISNTAGFFLILAAVSSKTSFALTLLRIVASTDVWAKKLVWFVIISVNLTLGLSGGLHWFWCWPSAIIWDRSIPGHCLPRWFINGYNISAAGFAGIMDILLALVAVRLVWTLTMNKQEKLGVAMAMAMGMLAGLTSILKIPAILNIDNGGVGNVINLMICGTAESAIMIIAACTPVLRNLHQSSLIAPSHRISLTEIKLGS